MRECNLIKNKHFTKIGGGLPECKKVFFWSLFWFWWFCFFFFSVFLWFCFVQNSPKWLFSCIFRGFLSILFPQKACLKVFVFFPFCFFFFCLPFQETIFSLPFVHQPLFYKRLFVGFLFFFFCLPFPFLRFACLFDTNFPNIPFLKPNLLLFLALCFSSVVVFVFIVYVSPFLFLCWFFLGVCLFLICVFVSVFFLVLLSVSEKRLFSLQFWCFFELCWLKG